ncbi:hypothetical protein HPB48_013757 [Haemaphysalis longicornis]|uniref:Uncharacterized protein n=1 Tax=Haemaphysalis longicornis TaxID=44386 RepID=A0A9J6FKG8_HAELO|nr:hypothetical protein HPB48_013757 [Haemaphysalis longicornis]
MRQLPLELPPETIAEQPEAGSALTVKRLDKGGLLHSIVSPAEATGSTDRRSSLKTAPDSALQGAISEGIKKPSQEQLRVASEMPEKEEILVPGTHSLTLPESGLSPFRDLTEAGTQPNESSVRSSELVKVSEENFTFERAAQDEITNEWSLVARYPTEYPGGSSLSFGPLVPKSPTGKRRKSSGSSSGGLFSHDASAPPTPKDTRQQSYVSQAHTPDGPPTCEGQPVTVTLPHFDSEVPPEDQISSDESPSSLEEKDIENLGKKEGVALALYDDAMAKIVKEARKNRDALLAQERRQTTTADTKLRTVESEPFLPGPEQSTSLPQILVPLPTRPEKAGQKLEQLSESKIPVRKPIETAPLFKSKHDVSVIPVSVEPTKQIQRGLRQRTDHISAPWASGHSRPPAEATERGRSDSDNQLLKVTKKNKRVERRQEKKTSKYAVAFKDGQAKSISSSSDSTEPPRYENREGFAYEYFASEEQSLEKIVTSESVWTKPPVQISGATAIQYPEAGSHGTIGEASHAQTDIEELHLPSVVEEAALPTVLTAPRDDGGVASLEAIPRRRRRSSSIQPPTSALIRLQTGQSPRASIEESSPFKVVQAAQAKLEIQDLQLPPVVEKTALPTDLAVAQDDGGAKSVPAMPPRRRRSSSIQPPTSALIRLGTGESPRASIDKSSYFKDVQAVQAKLEVKDVQLPPVVEEAPLPADLAVAQVDGGATSVAAMPPRRRRSSSIQPPTSALIRLRTGESPRASIDESSYFKDMQAVQAQIEDVQLPPVVEEAAFPTDVAVPQDDGVVAPVEGIPPRRRRSSSIQPPTSALIKLRTGESPRASIDDSSYFKAVQSAQARLEVEDLQLQPVVEEAAFPTDLAVLQDDGVVASVEGIPPRRRRSSSIRPPTSALIKLRTGESPRVSIDDSSYFKVMQSPQAGAEVEDLQLQPVVEEAALPTDLPVLQDDGVVASVEGIPPRRRRSSSIRPPTSALIKLRTGESPRVSIDDSEYFKVLQAAQTKLEVEDLQLQPVVEEAALSTDLAVLQDDGLVAPVEAIPPKRRRSSSIQPPTSALIRLRTGGSPRSSIDESSYFKVVQAAQAKLEVEDLQLQPVVEEAASSTDLGQDGVVAPVEVLEVFLPETAVPSAPLEVVQKAAEKYVYQMVIGAPEPSYFETTPVLEAFLPETAAPAARPALVQKAAEKYVYQMVIGAPEPSYFETTPVLEAFLPETAALAARPALVQKAAEKYVYQMVIGAPEPSYFETTPVLEAFLPETATPAARQALVQKAAEKYVYQMVIGAPEPSYFETTPVLEAFLPETSALIAPPALVQKAAEKYVYQMVIGAPEPSYFETTPVLEAFLPETSAPIAPPKAVQKAAEKYVYQMVIGAPEPSYFETTPVLEAFLPETSALAAPPEAAQKAAEKYVYQMVIGAPDPSYFETTAVVEYFLPETAAPATRPEAVQDVVEKYVYQMVIGAPEPSYFETTPVLEAFLPETAAPAARPALVQKAAEKYVYQMVIGAPEPSYFDTTPVLEAFLPETAVPVERKGSVHEVAEKYVYQMVIGAPEPSYLETTAVVEYFLPETAVPVERKGSVHEVAEKYVYQMVIGAPEPSYLETTPVVEAFLPETALPVERKGSVHEVAEKYVYQMVIGAPEPSYLETTPVVEAFLPETALPVERKGSVHEVAEKYVYQMVIGAPEPSYLETTAVVEYFLPETAVPVERKGSVHEVAEKYVYQMVIGAPEPSYLETTPVVEAFLPETALPVERKGSVHEVAEKYVYQMVIGAPEPSYFETTAVVEAFLPETAVPVERKGSVHEIAEKYVYQMVIGAPEPSYFETTPVLEAFLPETAAPAARPALVQKAAEKYVYQMVIGAPEPSYFETTPVLEAFLPETAAPAARPALVQKAAEKYVYQMVIGAPEPSYFETTPVLEAFLPETSAPIAPRKAVQKSAEKYVYEMVIGAPEPSYSETTPVLEAFLPETSAPIAPRKAVQKSAEKYVYEMVIGAPEPSYSETTPVLEAFLPETAAPAARPAVVQKAAEKYVYQMVIGAPEPSYFETTPVLEAFLPETSAPIAPPEAVQEAAEKYVYQMVIGAPEPSYFETTPVLEAFLPLTGAPRAPPKDVQVAAKKTGAPHVMPPPAGSEDVTDVSTATAKDKPTKKQRLGEEARHSHSEELSTIEGILFVEKISLPEGNSLLTEESTQGAETTSLSGTPGSRSSRSSRHSSIGPPTAALISLLESRGGRTSVGEPWQIKLTPAVEASIEESRKLSQEARLLRKMEGILFMEEISSSEESAPDTPEGTHGRKRRKSSVRPSTSALVSLIKGLSRRSTLVDVEPSVDLEQRPATAESDYGRGTHVSSAEPSANRMGQEPTGVMSSHSGTPSSERAGTRPPRGTKAPPAPTAPEEPALPTGIPQPVIVEPSHFEETSFLGEYDDTLAGRKYSREQGGPTAKQRVTIKSPQPIKSPEPSYFEITPTLYEHDTRPPELPPGELTSMRRPSPGAAAREVKPRRSSIRTKPKRKSPRAGKTDTQTLERKPSGVDATLEQTPMAEPSSSGTVPTDTQTLKRKPSGVDATLEQIPIAEPSPSGRVPAGAPEASSTETIPPSLAPSHDKEVLRKPRKARKLSKTAPTETFQQKVEAPAHSTDLPSGTRLVTAATPWMESAPSDARDAVHAPREFVTAASTEQSYIETTPFVEAQFPAEPATAPPVSLPPTEAKMELPALAVEIGEQWEKAFLERPVVSAIAPDIPVFEIPGSAKTESSSEELLLSARPPAATESELEIAAALQASREEARIREEQEATKAGGAFLPEEGQRVVDVASSESLARTVMSEREFDGAYISSTEQPPGEPLTHSEFQESLKQSSFFSEPSSTDIIMRRPMPDHHIPLPAASGESARRPSAEAILDSFSAPGLGAKKEEEEVSELTAPGMAASSMKETQQPEKVMLRQPSITRTVKSAVGELPVAEESDISLQIQDKMVRDLQPLPRASLASLVSSVGESTALQERDNFAEVVPSATSSSVSVQDRRRRSGLLRTPEASIPALSEEAHMPRPPPSINVPVINIQYNFHFPPAGSADPSEKQQQPPLTAEQLMANRVLQGALSQQGKAGHIPNQHVLNPEREAVRRMTERLHQVAEQGTEPYTGRQSPARQTLFHQLPKTPTVRSGPALRGRGGSGQSERRAQRGTPTIFAVLAFLAFVLFVLYALGFIGRRKYFMYYS